MSNKDVLVSKVLWTWVIGVALACAFALIMTQGCATTDNLLLEPVVNESGEHMYFNVTEYETNGVVVTKTETEVKALPEEEQSKWQGGYKGPIPLKSHQESGLNYTIGGVSTAAVLSILGAGWWFVRKKKVGAIQAKSAKSK